MQGNRGLKEVCVTGPLGFSGDLSWVFSLTYPSELVPSSDASLAVAVGTSYDA